MDLARVAGGNHVFAAPADWDVEKQGPYPIQTVRLTKDEAGATVAVSAWQPTEKERDLLARGAPVLLYLWVGDVHPRVALHAGEAP